MNPYRIVLCFLVFLQAFSNARISELIRNSIRLQHNFQLVLADDRKRCMCKSIAGAEGCPATWTPYFSRCVKAETATATALDAHSTCDKVKAQVYNLGFLPGYGGGFPLIAALQNGDEFWVRKPGSGGSEYAIITYFNNAWTTVSESEMKLTAKKKVLCEQYLAV